MATQKNSLANASVEALLQKAAIVRAAQSGVTQLIDVSEIYCDSDQVRCEAVSEWRDPAGRPNPPAIEPESEPSPNLTPLDELRALALSIARDGLLQPIAVSARAGGGWQVVMGERRVQACVLLSRWREAGLVESAFNGKISATVLDITSQLHLVQMQLSENMIRADMTPVDIGRAVKKLRDGGRTMAEIGELVGRSVPTLEGMLRLSESPELESVLIDAGVTNSRVRQRVAQHAATLDDVARGEYVNRVMDNTKGGMSPRHAERAAREGVGDQPMGEVVSSEPDGHTDESARDVVIGDDDLTFGVDTTQSLEQLVDTIDRLIDGFGGDRSDTVARVIEHLSRH